MIPLTRPLHRHRLAAAIAAALVGAGGSAGAAINLPKLPSIAALKPKPFTNCVNQVTDYVGGGAQAIGEYGTDGSRARNLRSAYLTAPVDPVYTPAGTKAKTPTRYLSKLRPGGVMIGAGYVYLPGQNGQETVQLDHVLIRAPFVVSSGFVRTHDPAGAIVRLSLGEAVYEGEAKIVDGGIDFYVSAHHPVETGYVALRQEDQAAFARAAASQTPFQVVVLDPNNRQELYSATVSMAPGLKQKSLMDQALASAATYYAKGYDSPLCHPPGVSID